MKKFVIILFLTICSQLICSFKVDSQELPVITNELGDTLSYRWPFTDNWDYVKDEIVIKFKKNALYLDRLCYSFSGPPTPIDPGDWYAQQKENMMYQQFPVDTLVADSSLREKLKFYGGQYLSRITWANPCTDSISISRFGDTIIVENYLWMTLKLDNDTSAIDASLNLTIYYQNVIDEAEPNFLGQFDAQPNDIFFQGTTYENKRCEQKSLKSTQSNVARAWDYQPGGVRDIKICVIDNGVDYLHCDFGGDFGIDKKIVDIWNYEGEKYDIINGSRHGTPVTGIIGALTNGAAGFCTNGNHMAGIAGGWLTGFEWTEENLGCSIYSMKVDVIPDEEIPISRVIGAIRDASTFNPGSENNWGIHVINCSWAYKDNEKTAEYIPALHKAFNYA